jgi:hypothetical protein
LECQIMKVFIQSGWTFDHATESSDDIVRFVLGNWKYKPVGKKAHPIALYNPDSQLLVFNPLKLGEFPPLLSNPMKLEDIKYME